MFCLSVYVCMCLWYVVYEYVFVCAVYMYVFIVCDCM